MGNHAAGKGRVFLRITSLACAALMLALLAACGGGGSSSSSGSGDWFYHWNCNGDSECLATNPTGAASGTLDEGPVQVNCTQLLTFGNQFWGPAATQSCDQNSNGSSGGGGGGGGSTPTISSFSPTASAPCTQVTITGTNFPSTVSGATVTIDGLTATVTAITSTSITLTLPCAMPNFTGPFTVKTSGGSATSTGSFTTVNHFYGVAASSSQFVAVGGGGTIETSPDGTTWTAQTSNTTNSLYAVTASSSAFVVVGQSGTVLRSTDGINWTKVSIGNNSTDFFAVNWNGSQFAIIGDSLEDFTSPDGITWTGHPSIPLAAVYGGLASSGTEYVAVGGANNASPTIIDAPDASAWTQVTTTAPNGNQLFGLTFGNSEFVAVGNAGTIITSSNSSTWTRQTDSQVGDLFGVTFGGGQFVAVGFDSSTVGSVIVTSPDGVTWTGHGLTSTNRSLNAVTFGQSEYVAVGGYGTIVTSLNGSTWTLRAGH